VRALLGHRTLVAHLVLGLPDRPGEDGGAPLGRLARVLVRDVVRHSGYEGPRTQGEDRSEDACWFVPDPFPPDDPSDVRLETPCDDDDREQRVRLGHEAADHDVTALADRMALRRRADRPAVDDRGRKPDRGELIIDEIVTGARHPLLDRVRPGRFA
jgi:hypothetical protein